MNIFKTKYKLYGVLGFIILSTIFGIGLIWELQGSITVTNECGYLRGTTQKLINQVYQNKIDEGLIESLDETYLYFDKESSSFDFVSYYNDELTTEYLELKVIWTKMKEEIQLIENGAEINDTLYDLGNEHFTIADEMVLLVENKTLVTSYLFIGVYLIGIIILISLIQRSSVKFKTELETSLTTDTLTSAYNRHGFLIEAKKMINNGLFSNLTIIKLDIVNYKKICKIYGYNKAECILYDIVDAIQLFSENSPIVSHTNSDNFYILLDYSENILDNLDIKLKEILINHEINLYEDSNAFRFGIYSIKEKDTDIKILTDYVSIAHSIAKETKQHKVWYNSKLINEINQKALYLDRLDDAILNNEFKLYLQPQVELATNKIISAESLVRWELSNAIIYPNAFIHMYEEAHVIDKLDFYMLEKVCKYLKDRQIKNQPLFPIAINFSRLTLSKANFYEDFVEIIKKYDIPLSYIGVEILENALSNENGDILNLLNLLKNNGYYVLMDDFGAGYSSLGFLSQVSVSTLKLDRQFLMQYDKDKKVNKIIKAIVELAHTLDIKVICEGVETIEHVNMLKQFNCEYGQGYYFSKPIPSQEFILD